MDCTYVELFNESCSDLLRPGEPTLLSSDMTAVMYLCDLLSCDQFPSPGGCEHSPSCEQYRDEQMQRYIVTHAAAFSVLYTCDQPGQCNIHDCWQTTCLVRPSPHAVHSTNKASTTFPTSAETASSSSTNSNAQPLLCSDLIYDLSMITLLLQRGSR